MKFHTPRLSELQSNRNAELVKKTTLAAEIAILRAQMTRETPRDGNAADNRVRAIMGETIVPDISPDTVKLGEMLQDAQIITRSIGIFDGLIAKEKAVASKLLCEAETPEVARLGKAFAKAFVDLHTAQQAYHKHLDKIQDTGASISSLPHVFISGLGHGSDRSGTFFYGMRDFIEAGYLSSLPKEFQ
ncbi:hypothetical protein QCM80_45335 [Bradyrhizobium sp. SSUT112]|uniref:hypothetical protein n=1 Tax=Bradyrhizobium sp. SSUT112 TaxID=3040604 RepID=UPI00244A1592|nr:hypothetical protein [Bradyrhizobium sp. SSUT112]MDH2357693.1 hypothetical protein [Bradyrhizobium sp. SSUT112]